MSVVEVAGSPSYDRDLVDLDTYRAEFARALLEAVERHRPPMVVRIHGACVGEDPRLFFPSRNDKVRPAARVICRKCPVADECLAWAMRQGPTLEGTWGGTSWADRR